MEHYDWNDGWLFCPTFDPALVRPECTGLELESVRIPHTVKALPYNYCNENDHQRLCGYRREFFAPAEWAGRTVLLTFGAIAHDATVFCNGRRLFHHGCGYTAFTVDLTSALHLGKKNVVAVRCDSREDLNIPPFGGSIDYLTYGGIYRAVSLDIKEPAYLRDVFVEARAEGDFRIYTATVGETVGCTLQAEIRSPAGSRAVYRGELALPITGTLNGVHPWSIEHPTLYTLTVKLIRPGTSGLPDRVLDEKTVRFGFRTVQFVAGGLYLNGQRVVLRGINRHQSYAYQGYAMPDSLQRLDAQFIKKDLGCNAVRTSHYPQSPAFLDACDELGLLVFTEMPGWYCLQRHPPGHDQADVAAAQNEHPFAYQIALHVDIALGGTGGVDAGRAGARDADGPAGALPAAHAEDDALCFEDLVALLLADTVDLFIRRDLQHHGAQLHPDAGRAQHFNVAPGVLRAGELLAETVQPEAVVDALVQDAAQLVVTLQNQNIAQAVLPCAVGCGKACRAAADDDQINHGWFPPAWFRTVRRCCLPCPAGRPAGRCPASG